MAEFSCRITALYLKKGHALTFDELHKLFSVVDAGLLSHDYINAEIATAIWGEPTPTTMTAYPRVLAWHIAHRAYTFPPDFISNISHSFFNILRDCYIGDYNIAITLQDVTVTINASGITQAFTIDRLRHNGLELAVCKACLFIRFNQPEDAKA